MQKKYTVAIIGLGRIGYLFSKDKKREQPASHSNAFFYSNRTQIIAGCDIDKMRLKDWHRHYTNANVYTNYKTLLKKENPDIIVVSVGEKFHKTITIDVIKSHPKLIVLEKPVAPSLKEANIIYKYSQSHNIPILINHERQFSLDYLKVKKLLNKNYIGKIHTILGNLWSNIPVWNDTCSKTGRCSLVHDGTHLIDIILFLTNSSNITNIKIDNIRKQKGIVTSINFNFILNKNILCYIENSGQKKYFGFEVELRGSKGRIIIGNGYLKIYKFKVSPFYSNFYSLARIKKFKRPKKTNYFSNMVTHCVDFLDKKESLHSPISSGVKILKIINKLFSQIKLYKKK